MKQAEIDLSHRLAKLRMAKVITDKGPDWWSKVVKSAERNKSWDKMPKSYKAVFLEAEKEIKARQK